MSENFHKKLTPKKDDLPIINKLILAYKKWQEFLIHFPKTSRFSLGSKIDLLFIEIIELIYLAVTMNPTSKIPYLVKANTKLDLLKFFLQIAWRIKALDDKKYISLSADFDELGRMLGGWIRQLKEKLPPKTEE